MKSKIESYRYQVSPYVRIFRHCNKTGDLWISNHKSYGFFSEWSKCNYRVVRKEEMKSIISNFDNRLNMTQYFNKIFLKQEIGEEYWERVNSLCYTLGFQIDCNLTHSQYKSLNKKMQDNLPPLPF